MKFEYQKSYLWLFGVFVLLLIGGALVSVINFRSTVWTLILPGCIAFLLVSELRSGVALDGMWRARYQKGTWQYLGLIALKLGALIVSTVWSVKILTQNH